MYNIIHIILLYITRPHSTVLYCTLCTMVRPVRSGVCRMSGGSNGKTNGVHGVPQVLTSTIWFIHSLTRTRVVSRFESVWESYCTVLYSVVDWARRVASRASHPIRLSDCAMGVVLSRGLTTFSAPTLQDAPPASRDTFTQRLVCCCYSIAEATSPFQGLITIYLLS